MSTSYARNIERLRANQRSVSAQEQGITTAAARDRGEYEIAHARDITNKLTPFSTALQEWKEKDIEKKIEEGRAELDKAKVENAKWLEEHGTETQKRIRRIEEAQKAGELAFEIEDAQAQEIELQRLKGELLKRQGTDGYPDADRLAQLSPWQQVGYVQQDIKNKKAMIPDMLAHSMQNGEENITLGNITYNAKEISGNKLAFKMKEHATHYYMDKIYRNLGLHKYSDEMLRRSKVAETVRTAKEAEIAKHRKMYNIESSMNTQKKATLTWNESEQNGKDVEQFLLTVGATVDTKNQLLNNKGALDSFFQLLVQDGVKKGGDNTLLQKVHNLPIPENLRQRLGAKAGATFGSHWKNRFKSANQSIMDGNTKVIENRLKNQNAQAKDITTRFKAAAAEAHAKGRTLSKQEVLAWEAQYPAVGAVAPKDVTDYQTASMRSQAADEVQIKAHISLNEGITNAELDTFHPLAAAKYRKQADAYEKGILDKTGAKGLIKAALDNTFADMGIKDREKSQAYQIAKKNAEEDFSKQYTEYVEMGLSSDVAAYLALHGVEGLKTEIPAEVKSYIQGRKGVTQEINENGENSKYTKAGLHIEKIVGSQFDIMAHALTAKKEMREANAKGTLLRKTKIIGGQYGQDQLDAIKKNIKLYGLHRGLAMSEEHIQYYKAIMAGRRIKEGGWYGLLHDQLLVDDPEGKGLEHNTAVKSVLPLLNKKVPAETEGEEEEDLEDNDGVTKVSDAGINAANNKAPLLAYNYITDADNYYNNKSNNSVFDQPDQIPSYLGGTA